MQEHRFTKKTLSKPCSVQAMSGKWKPLKGAEQCEAVACPGIHCSVFRFIKINFFWGGRVFTM